MDAMTLLIFPDHSLHLCPTCHIRHHPPIRVRTWHLRLFQLHHFHNLFPMMFSPFRYPAWFILPAHLCQHNDHHNRFYSIQLPPRFPLVCYLGYSLIHTSKIIQNPRCSIILLHSACAIMQFRSSSVFFACSSLAIVPRRILFFTFCQATLEKPWNQFQ